MSPRFLVSVSGSAPTNSAILKVLFCITNLLLTFLFFCLIFVLVHPWGNLWFFPWGVKNYSLNYGCITNFIIFFYIFGGAFMRVKLLGVQLIDMTAKNGDHIKGANLFVGFKNRYVDGIKTQKYFVNDDDYVTSGVCNLQPDEEFNIFFDDNGKIDSMDIEVN